MSIMSKIDIDSVSLSNVYPDEHPVFSSAVVEDVMLDDRWANKEELQFINTQHEWILDNVLQIVEAEWVHYMY